MTVAAARVLTMSADESNRLLAISRERWLLDRKTLQNEISRSLERGRAEGLAAGETKGRAEGRAEGLAAGETKGRAEGRAEGVADVVRGMLASKMSLSAIARITGLPMAEVERLAAEWTTASSAGKPSAN